MLTDVGAQAPLPCRASAGERISPAHYCVTPCSCDTSTAHLVSAGPLLRLPGWRVSAAGAGGEGCCSSGLQTAPCPGNRDGWVDGSSWEAAPVPAHPESRAVRVPKPLRIILPAVGGFYRLGLFSVGGGRSAREGALEGKAEVHSSCFCSWISPVCCCHGQF